MHTKHHYHTNRSVVDSAKPDYKFVYNTESKKTKPLSRTVILLIGGGVLASYTMFIVYKVINIFAS